MKKIIVIFQLLFITVLCSSFQYNEEKQCTLTVKVNDLRNSDGLVQFTLYNTENALPDEEFKKYYRKLCAKVVDESSEVTFKNLPQGKYAVNILHDEDADGTIKKGFILPVEGVGFSNYQSIGLSNRPTFNKASFMLNINKSIEIFIIYM